MHKFVRGRVIKDHQLDSHEFGKGFCFRYLNRKMFA
jgi:hypothetical protein